MVSPIVLGYTQQLEEYLVPELEEEVALVLYVQYNSASTGIFDTDWSILVYECISKAWISLFGFL